MVVGDMPEWFVAVAAFPLTASGKILKRELVDWVRAGRVAPMAVRWGGPKGDRETAADLRSEEGGL